MPADPPPAAAAVESAHVALPDVPVKTRGRYNKIRFNIDNFGTKSHSNGSSKTLQLLRTSWLRFLHITAPREEPRNPGAKSLLSMALRSTSSWILREQQLADEEADDVDVADDMFTHLEEMYGHGNGWKPLKELVRQHGIRLICDAIHRRWFPVSIIEYLGSSTKGERHWDAAEAIYAAYRESLAPWLDKPTCSLHRPGSCYDMYRPYDMIIAYRKSLPGGSFTWREMAKSITEGQIPVEWIPSLSMQDVVTEALKSIVAEDAHSFAAAQFITSVIRKAAGIVLGGHAHVKKNGGKHPQMRGRPARDVRNQHMRDSSNMIDDELAEALNNSVASFLKILGVAHTRHNHQSSECGDNQQFTLMYTVVSDILSRFNHLSRRINYMRTEEKLRCGYVFIAFFVYMADGSNSSACLDIFENFTKSLKDRSFFVKGLVKFVINLCCGRKSDVEAGYPYLQQVISFFLAVDGTSHPTLRAVLGKIAVDAALDFAALTLCPEHHQFAASIQQQVEARRVVCTVELTPSLAMRGYKWDDGFGEWVVSTPAPARGYRAKRVVFSDSDSSGGDDDEEDSDSAKPRQESPIVYDSQGDTTIVSSQGSTIFSASSMKCISNATTPSPSRKRTFASGSDESDNSEARLQQMKKPRRSNLQRELEQLRASLLQNDSSDDDDKALNFSRVKLQRRELRSSTRQAEPQRRPRLTRGGRHLRPRWSYPSDPIRIYEDKSPSESESPASAPEAASRTSGTSVETHTRYSLRERRSVNILAGSSHRSPPKICNFAIVIDNSAYKPSNDIALRTQQEATESQERSGHSHAEPVMPPTKRTAREQSPVVMETDYEHGSEDELTDLPRRKSEDPRWYRSGQHRLTRPVSSRLRRVSAATSSRRKAASFDIPTPEESSDDELSLLV
ncbi:hypothetical protein KEM56_003916 [Ascosphaera pollenicola]|nr:hypothetical protein KEM56_003916 [Ascosphaera pollenicola]